MMVRVSHAPLSPTDRSTVKRGRERAVEDRQALYDVLDSSLICHLGMVIDGRPLVLPTGFGRDDDTLYLHGSSGAASLLAMSHSAPVCVAVTRLDGVVYARSVFHHSMNYASAVVHGIATPISDRDAKLRGLHVLTEHMAPGSWANTRPPTRKELAKTAVFSVSLHEASVKLRSGPPGDDDEDVRDDGPWAGVLPIRQVWGSPDPCPLLPDEAKSAPEHVANRV